MSAPVRNSPPSLCLASLLLLSACGLPEGAPDAIDSNASSIYPDAPAPKSGPAASPTLAPVDLSAGLKLAATDLGADVLDDRGELVASFTTGARSVRIVGPKRTLHESTSAHDVVTRDWIRVLPAPFEGTVDWTWLASARASAEPDVIAIALQYVSGAPELLDANGWKLAGDAHYGPLVGTARTEGADFNDYLGLDWRYADGTLDPAEVAELGSLDCSGFVRMVWGLRAAIPLGLAPAADRSVLPRRSFELYESAPGVVVIPETSAPDRARLQAGDLVFFDADTSDGTRIDHVGLYLGLDRGGHPRFVSSRKSADGPTMEDTNGPSLLDGTMLYGRSFRAARRL